MKAHSLTVFLLIACITNYSTVQSQNDYIPPHQTFEIESHKVNETRTINVWLPENYEKDSDSLSVLYMADGGIQEDFSHIANTLAELIASKKIKPIILVGIENTERRRDLTGPTDVEKDREIAPKVGGSENFRNFIKDELIPEINTRYRTTSKKGIIGESLSGLFVVETFLLHPEMFDFYIAFDPSMWWNNRYLVKNAVLFLDKFPFPATRIWFASSSARDISGTVGKFANVLAKKNVSNLKWLYTHEPKEKHHTIFRSTKEKALIWTLNN